MKKILTKTTFSIISIINTFVFLYLFGATNSISALIIAFTIITGIVYVVSLIWIVSKIINKNEKKLFWVIVLTVIILISIFTINYGWKRASAFNSCITKHSLQSKEFATCTKNYTLMNWLNRDRYEIMK